MDFAYTAFGYAVRLTANDRRVLDAGRLSAPRFGATQPLPDNLAIELTLIVVPTLPDAPVPSDLASGIQTFGVGDVLWQAAPPWLHAMANIRERRACAALSPALAAEPRLVSRYILDRFVNNMALREGLGQLHATCVVKGDCALLLIAPHGTGKSTTAFHLLNTGYQLMADSLVYVRRRGDVLELMGYPTGEGRLTAEMEARFPHLRGQAAEITVHGVRKNVVDLREVVPDKITESSLRPGRVVLCLVERDGAGQTRAERLSADDTLRRLLPDTLYLDDLTAMAASLECVRRLVERAQCWRLTLGADPVELVRAIEGL
ncbi:MAG: hypothetical protein HY260_22210 [Chloroflexi bacterium]|nr:hypothetical protein [Chloroflexota bacterium]